MVAGKAVCIAMVGLGFAVNTFGSLITFDLFGDSLTIGLQATTDVPHNPAVEDDQIRVFIELVVP